MCNADVFINFGKFVLSSSPFFLTNEFIPSQFWKSEVRNQFSGLKSKSWQGLTPSGGPRGGFLPCVFQLLKAASIPWLVATSFPSLSSSSHCLPLCVFYSILMINSLINWCCVSYSWCSLDSFWSRSWGFWISCSKYAFSHCKDTFSVWDF